MNELGHEVCIVGATKRYGQLAALNNFSLTLSPGTFTVLLGPSGSGKSTLIRSVAGIEKLDEGSIFFGASEVNSGPVNVAAEKRNLAMVFQDYALWPHLTALENVKYALKRRKLDSTTATTKSAEALERVGLDSKQGNYPHELSGGEQQRVALARAIVARPALLLFDEPLSNLDADLRERLRIEISTLTREIGSTALYITHDQAEAFALADVIGVLRSGGLEQFDSPENIYKTPASRFVASFTGLSGSFNGTISSITDSGATVDLGGASITSVSTEKLSVGQQVDILIRPSAASLTPNGTNPISGTVIDIAYRGRGYDYVVETQHGVLAGISSPMSMPRHSKLNLYFDATGCIAFPRESL